MWYVPPPRVLEHFVARDESPTGWDQMQNVNLQTEPGRFMATFVRTGSYNNCVIKVHGKQYFNGYENTEEELDNVPLKSLQSTSVTNVPPSSTQHFGSILKKPGVQSPVTGRFRALDAGLGAF